MPQCDIQNLALQKICKPHPAKPTYVPKPAIVKESVVRMLLLRYL